MQVPGPDGVRPGPVTRPGVGPGRVTPQRARAASPATRPGRRRKGEQQGAHPAQPDPQYRAHDFGESS